MRRVCRECILRFYALFTQVYFIFSTAFGGFCLTDFGPFFFMPHRRRQEAYFCLFNHACGSDATATVFQPAAAPSLSLLPPACLKTGAKNEEKTRVVSSPFFVVGEWVYNKQVVHIVSIIQTPACPAQPIQANFGDPSKACLTASGIICLFSEIISSPPFLRSRDLTVNMECWNGWPFASNAHLQWL